MAEAGRVTSEDLGLSLLPDSPDSGTGSLDLRTVREHAERQAVVAAFARTDGNVARTAEILGVSRPTLYDLMNRLQIK